MLHILSSPVSLFHNHSIHLSMYINLFLPKVFLQTKGRLTTWGARTTGSCSVSPCPKLIAPSPHTADQLRAPSSTDLNRTEFNTSLQCVSDNVFMRKHSKLHRSFTSVPKCAHF